MSFVTVNFGLWSQRSFFFKKKQFFFEKFERDLNFQENTVVSSARAATTPPTAYAACLLDGCWFSEPAARSLAHVQKLCGRRRHMLSEPRPVPKLGGQTCSERAQRTQSACPAAGRRQAGRPG
jgi:hypothetical protein